VSRYQKGKTNLDFTEARDSEWQWHQPGHMQVCISLHAVTWERRYGPSRLLINDDDLAPDDDASTPPIRFLQAGCPSCRPSKCQSTEQKNKTNKHKSSYLTSQSLKVSVRNHEDWFTTAEFFLHILWHTNTGCLNWLSTNGVVNNSLPVLKKYSITNNNTAAEKY